MADNSALSFDALVKLNLQQAEAQWNAFQRRSGTFRPTLDRSRFGIGGLTNDVSKLDKSLISATNRVTSLGAAFSVFLGVQQAFSSFIKSTIDVEAALARINVNLELTGSELKEFSRGLFDVARLTGSTFSDAARAAEEFARQGLSVTEVLKRTRDAQVLARIAAIDVGEATTDLTAAVNTFSKEALTTTEIVNRLAAVDTRFAVSSRDLGLAISRVGNSAQEAGVSFNELLGIVTAVQQTTQRGGSVIGNSLKTIFTRISRPEVLQQLEALGVATRDLNNNNLPAIQILKNLSAQYDTLSTSQKSVLAEQVGGVYQINILKAAVADLSKETSTYSQVLGVASNAQDEAFTKNAELNRTLQASISGTANTIKELFSSIGNQRTSGILKFLADQFDNVRETLGSKSEGVGATIGEGLVQGISNVLTGPVLVGATVAIFKGLGTILKTFQASLRAELGLKTVSEQRAQVQQRINELLGIANASELRAISNATTVLGQRAALLAIEQRISAEKARQIVSDAALQSSFIVPGLRGGVTPGLKVGKAAEGYVPALNGRQAADGYLPAIVQEQRSVARGVGGASPTAKPVVIPNFAFGGGKTGALVANSDEYIVLNYKNSGGSAIFNPKMIRELGLPNGAQKISAAAGGLIPAPSPGKTAGAALSRSAVRAATGHVPAIAGGHVPNFANTPFGKYLNEIDPSYLKRFLELEKKDPKLGDFLRKAVDQKNPKAILGFQEYLGGKHVQSTPAAFGLDTTTYFDLDDEPETIRGKVGEVFGRFKQKSPLDSAASGYTPPVVDTGEGMVRKAAYGAIPTAAAGRGVRRGEKVIGSGMYGDFLRAPGSPIGFKKMLGNALFTEGEIRDEYAVSKLAEQLNLPVAKVYGSANRSVKRGGIYKEYIDGETGAEAISEQMHLKVRRALEKQFEAKGIHPVDLHSGNYVIRKGADLTDINDVIRNAVVVDAGGFSTKDDYAEMLRNYRSSAASGYVPNLAAALTREKQAGVDPKSIYIDRDSRVKSAGNPQGLLVANRRDEPNGGFQGVDRVIRQGGNPRTAGALRGAAGGYVPNYALTSQDSLPLSQVAARPGGFEGFVRGLDISNVNFDTSIRKTRQQILTAIEEALEVDVSKLAPVAKRSYAKLVTEVLTTRSGEIATIKSGQVSTRNKGVEEIESAERARQAERSAKQVRERDFILANKELSPKGGIPQAPTGQSRAEAEAERAKSIDKGFQLLEKETQLSKDKARLAETDIRLSEKVLGTTQKLYGQARQRGAELGVERPQSKLPPTFSANQAIRGLGDSFATGPQASSEQLSALRRANEARNARIVRDSVGEPGNVTPNEGPTRAEAATRRSGSYTGLPTSEILKRLEQIEFAQRNEALIPANESLQGLGKIDPKLLERLKGGQPKPSLATRAGNVLRSPGGSIGLALGAPLAAGLIDSFSTRLPGKGVGGTAGGIGAGLASGALQGAAIGSLAGPVGAGVGAAVGALVGALGKATKSVAEFDAEIEERNSKGRQQLSELDEFIQLQTAYNAAFASGNDEALRNLTKSQKEFTQNASPETAKRIKDSGSNVDTLKKLRDNQLVPAQRKAEIVGRADSALNTVVSKTFFKASKQENETAARAVSTAATNSEVDLSKYKLDGSFGSFASSRTSASSAQKDIAVLQEILTKTGSTIKVTSTNFKELAGPVKEAQKLQKENSEALKQQTSANKLVQASLLDVASKARKADFSRFSKQTALAGAVDRRQIQTSFDNSVAEGVSTTNQNIERKGAAEIQGARGQEAVQVGSAKDELNEALQKIISDLSLDKKGDNSKEAVALRSRADRAATGQSDTSELLDLAKALGATTQLVTGEQEKYALSIAKLARATNETVATIEARTSAEKIATEAIRRQSAFSNYTREQGAQIGQSIRGFGDKKGVSDGFLAKQDKAFLGFVETLKSLGGIITPKLKEQENQVRSKDQERNSLDFAKSFLSGLNLPGFRGATFEKRNGEADSGRIEQALTLAADSTRTQNAQLNASAAAILEAIKAQRENREKSGVDASGRPQLRADKPLSITAYAGERKAANTGALLTPEKERQSREAANKYVLSPQKSADDRERARKFIEQGGTPRLTPPAGVPALQGKVGDKSDPEAKQIAALSLEAANALKAATEAFNTKQTTFTNELNVNVNAQLTNIDQFYSKESAIAFQDEISTELKKLATEFYSFIKQPRPPAAKR